MVATSAECANIEEPILIFNSRNGKMANRPTLGALLLAVCSGERAISVFNRAQLARNERRSL